MRRRGPSVCATACCKGSADRGSASAFRFRGENPHLRKRLSAPAPDPPVRAILWLRWVCHDVCVRRAPVRSSVGRVRERYASGWGGQLDRRAGRCRAELDAEADALRRRRDVDEDEDRTQATSGADRRLCNGSTTTATAPPTNVRLQTDTTTAACWTSCRTLTHASTAWCLDSECRIDACASGWVDADGLVANGCEYECTPPAAGERTVADCTDGLDNDCDGRVDATDSDCSFDPYELCDGTDDDGDGETDEDCACASGWAWENPLPQGNDLEAVWVAPDGTAFMVGAGGALLRHDDAGWTAVDTGTSVHLFDVWGVSADDIFVVGEGGTILHGEGGVWTTMPSGTSLWLSGVWGTAANDIFAVGDRGLVLHYDGIAWSTMGTFADYALRDVWGSSPTDVYAVGMLDALHYDGTAWTALAPAPDGDLHGVWGRYPFRGRSPVVRI